MKMTFDLLLEKSSFFWPGNWMSLKSKIFLIHFVKSRSNGFSDTLVVL